MATQLISTTSAITVPCVVFALRRESMFFRRAFPLQQHFPSAPCRAQFRGRGKKDKRDKRDEKRCQEPFFSETVPDTFFHLMLESGIGAASMASAVRWCLSGPCFAGIPYRPRFVISVGFSGALQPGLRVGDLVLATEIVDPQGNAWPTFRPKPFANRHLTAGRVLTMPELVGDPIEKQRLGREFHAVAVDMESAVAARLCYENKVPFACLRAISDDWQTPLSPHLVDLLRHGRVAFPQLMGKMLRHPQLIGELWRLAGHTRLAARRLAGPLATVNFHG